MKRDLGRHRSGRFGGARGEHRAGVNEKWRVTRGIDPRGGAVATDQQHTARIGAEAGRDRAVGLHAITFDVGRPFSFPIPFVSSEVETPIGTALGRGASRLRSMRTDLLAITMPLRSPIGGDRNAVELAVRVARQFVPPFDRLRLPDIGEILAKLCRESLFGGGALRSEERRVGKGGVSTCRSRWWPIL